MFTIKTTTYLFIIVFYCTLQGMEVVPLHLLQKEILFRAIESSQNIQQSEQVRKSCALVCKKWHQIVGINNYELLKVFLKIPLKVIDAVPLYCMYTTKLSYQQENELLGQTNERIEFGLHVFNRLNSCVKKKLQQLQNKKSEIKENFLQEEIDQDKQLALDFSIRFRDNLKKYKEVINDLKKGWKGSMLNSNQGMQLFYKQLTDSELDLMHRLIDYFCLDKKVRCYQSIQSTQQAKILEVDKIIFDQFQSIFNLEIKKSQE